MNEDRDLLSVAISLLFDAISFLTALAIISVMFVPIGFMFGFGFNAAGMWFQ